MRRTKGLLSVTFKPDEVKILYIHQHFITNQGTGATRSFDVSRHLVEAGHEVTVVCGHYWQAHWERLPWWKPIETISEDGIKVVRCNVPYDNKMGKFGRAWAFLYFSFLASLVGLMESGVDIIFATSTPLTVALPARVISDLRRLPYIFEVRDLWPEDLVIADVMREGSSSHKFFAWLEKIAYSRAKKILTVSPGFTERLKERGITPERLQTIALGAEASLFADLSPNQAFLDEHNLADKVVAVYAGAHGPVNGLEVILDAANELRDHPELRFLIVGDGMMKRGLQQRAQAEDLSNVVFCQPLPKRELLRILATCDIGLMLLRDRGIPWLVTPNKLFDYLFSGLPVLVNFDGTTAELVSEHDCGVAAQQGNMTEFVDALRTLADNSKRRQELGENGQALAHRKFSREVLSLELLACFKEVLRSQGQ